MRSVRNNCWTLDDPDASSIQWGQTANNVLSCTDKGRPALYNSEYILPEVWKTL